MESTPNTFPALIDPTIVSPGVDNKSTGGNTRTQVAQAAAANLGKSYYIPDSLNTPTAKIRRRVAVMLMVLI